MARLKERPLNALSISSRRRLKKIFTADDLLFLSSAVVDGRRYELIEGRLYEMPPIGAPHGEITANICSLLRAHVKQHELGRIFVGDPGFILQRDPDTVRAPDVAFVSYRRLPHGDLPEGFLQLAPDLAVEVVSPSNRPREILEKADAWLQAGVQVLWVVYPRTRSIDVHRPRHDVLTLSSDEMLEGSPALPGFSCQVGELFA